MSEGVETAVRIGLAKKMPTNESKIPLKNETITEVWTLNGQPKSMEDGDRIGFRLYRTDAEGELTLSADGYAADKGTATLNKPPEPYRPQTVRPRQCRPH